MVSSYRALLMVVGLAGCGPELIDGMYSCVDDESCPSGWSCHFDQLCYAEEQQGDGLYAVGCAMDDDCITASCWTGPDELSETMFCSAECVLDRDCPAVEGGIVYCLAGMCSIGCHSPADCPEQLRCYWPAGPVVGPGPEDFAGGCFAVGAPALAEGLAGCDSHPECSLPGGCWQSPELGGVCAIRCRAGSQCPEGQRCVEAQEGRFMCLRTCASNDDCAQMRCAAMAGEDNMYCVPELWFDNGLPVPAGSMP